MTALNYKKFGEGPPILILHGLFGMLDNWQTIGKKLGADYQVYLVDLRNHGRSPHSDEFSYDIMAGDVSSFMRLHNIDSATIIGHSMGGKVALQMATKAPEQIDRLISVDIGLKAQPRGHDVILAALGAIRLSEISSRNDAGAVLENQISDNGTRLFLMKNLTRNKEGGYSWKMNLPVLTEKYEEILKEVVFNNPFDRPTLFIRGGRSHYITDEDWEGFRPIFMNGRLVTIADAGHWVHADQPKLLLDTLYEFMAS